MRGQARGKTYARPAIKRASWWDLLPGGKRGRGVNIIPPINVPNMYADRFTRFADDTYVGSWNNWTKPSIDEAIDTYGCNLLRIGGTLWGRDPASPYGTPIPDDLFFSCWDTILNYCRSRGAFVHVTFSHGDNNTIDGGWPVGSAWQAYTPALSWLAPECAKIARYMVKHRDVIPCIDLINEAFTWVTTVEGPSQRGQQIYDAVKAVAPELLYGFSKTWLFQSLGVVPASMRDVVIGHIYYDASPGDVDVVLAAQNQPVLVGEFGKAFNAGLPARQAHYNAQLGVANNVVASAPNVGRRTAGHVAWCLRDYDTDPANQWGVAANDGTPRADVTAILQSFPTT